MFQPHFLILNGQQDAIGITVILSTRIHKLQLTNPNQFTAVWMYLKWSTLRYFLLWKLFRTLHSRFSKLLSLELCFFITKYVLQRFSFHWPIQFSQSPEPLIKYKNRYEPLDFAVSYIFTKKAGSRALPSLQFLLPLLQCNLDSRLIQAFGSVKLLKFISFFCPVLIYLLLSIIA